MQNKNNNKIFFIVFLGFALGTNKLGESFTNSNNTLGTLVSLGFASGTNDTLGIITTILHGIVNMFGPSTFQKLSMG